MNIGEYVRYRRMKANLTIRKLADRSRLSPTLLFNMESGKTEPKLSSLEKLAKGFGESEMKFLGGFYSRRSRNLER